MHRFLFTSFALAILIAAGPAQAGGRWRRSAPSNHGYSYQKTVPSQQVVQRPVAPSPALPLPDPKVDESYRNSVRWNFAKLSYLDASGNWVYAEEEKIATSDGYLPQGRDQLQFAKGDILFRVGDAWYKADAAKHPRPQVVTDGSEYEDLPREIKHFINVYQGRRPGMIFSRAIYNVAQYRAKVANGHVSNINQLIAQAGFRTPEWTTNHKVNSNTAESLWIASTAEGALDGWAGHGEHAVHVFGQTPFWAARNHYGIGYNPNTGQWVLLTSPPPIP